MKACDYRKYRIVFFKLGILVWNKPVDQSLCTQQSIELVPNSKLLLSRNLANKVN